MEIKNRPTERLLLRVEEAAQMTGIGKSRCYSMIASGELPSVRVGRSVRIPAKQLREWVEQLVAEQSLPCE